MKKGFEFIRGTAILSSLMAVPVILAYVSALVGIGDVSVDKALHIIVLCFFGMVVGLVIIVSIAGNEINKIEGGRITGRNK